jgi:hypothetical protein
VPPTAQGSHVSASLEDCAPRVVRSFLDQAPQEGRPDHHDLARWGCVHLGDLPARRDMILEIDKIFWETKQAS